MRMTKIFAGGEDPMTKPAELAARSARRPRSSRRGAPAETAARSGRRGPPNPRNPRRFDRIEGGRINVRDTLYGGSSGSLQQASQDWGRRIGTDTHVACWERQVVKVADRRAVVDASLVLRDVWVVLVVFFFELMFRLSIVVNTGTCVANRGLNRGRHPRINLIVLEHSVVCIKLSNCGRCIGGECDGKVVPCPGRMVI